MLKRAIIIAIISCCAASRANMYDPADDGLVVERSEIIVIAHIKADSFKGGPDPDYPGSQERVTLVIEKVLKGNVTEREIEISLYGNLSCSIAGMDPFSNAPHYHYAATGESKPAAGAINLHFECDSTMGASHLEASKVWLLQRHSAEDWSVIDKTGAFALTEFEEIQEAELKDYFQTYLSADPEASVRAYVATHPQLLSRARKYLEHKTVQRIVKISDVNERARRLAPYVVAGQEWKPDTFEARSATAACGDSGCALLAPIFKDAALGSHRCEIMEVWGAARYKPSVDLLIELLKKCEAYWAPQESIIRPFENYDILNETEAGVRALGNIGDPRGLEAVLLTAKRWGANINGQSLSKACEIALKQLGVTDK